MVRWTWSRGSGGLSRPRGTGLRRAYNRNSRHRRPQSRDGPRPVDGRRRPPTPDVSVRSNVKLLCDGHLPNIIPDIRHELVVRRTHGLDGHLGTLLSAWSSSSMCDAYYTAVSELNGYNAWKDKLCIRSFLMAEMLFLPTSMTTLWHSRPSSDWCF